MAAPKCPVHDTAMESKTRTVAIKDTRTGKELVGTTFETYWACPNGGCSYTQED